MEKYKYKTKIQCIGFSFSLFMNNSLDKGLAKYTACGHFF